MGHGASRERVFAFRFTLPDVCKNVYIVDYIPDHSLSGGRPSRSENGNDSPDS